MRVGIMLFTLRVTHCAHWPKQATVLAEPRYTNLDADLVYNTHTPPAYIHCQLTTSAITVSIRTTQKPSAD